MSSYMQQGGFGSDDAQEEQRGLIGRASDLAAGLKHPRTAFFHLIFKASAIFSYMFGTWISDSFVNVFIVCVLLLAFDFWTVKNVSGRLMVGLRWWSEVLDDGSTHRPDAPPYPYVCVRSCVADRRRGTRLVYPHLR